MQICTLHQNYRPVSSLFETLQRNKLTGDNVINEHMYRMASPSVHHISVNNVVSHMCLVKIDHKLEQGSVYKCKKIFFEICCFIIAPALLISNGRYIYKRNRYHSNFKLTQKRYELHCFCIVRIKLN